MQILSLDQDGKPSTSADPRALAEHRENMLKSLLPHTAVPNHTGKERKLPVTLLQGSINPGKKHSTGQRGQEYRAVL